MTKPNSTAIAVVLDASGSMAGVRYDTLGGLNTFIAEQKKLQGEVIFSLHTFDTTVNSVFNNKNLNEIPQIQDHHYHPNGNTALYDAIGLTIDQMGLYFSTLSENQRPSKVIVVILTDGEENSSRKETSVTIKQKIEHQESVYSWEFLFLGANQDACFTAATMGIPSAHSINYAASALGTRSAVAHMSDNVLRSRSGGKVAFTAGDYLSYDASVGVALNSPPTNVNPAITPVQATPAVTTQNSVEPWKQQVRLRNGKFGPKTI